MALKTCTVYWNCARCAFVRPKASVSSLYSETNVDFLFDLGLDFSFAFLKSAWLNAVTEDL